MDVTPEDIKGVTETNIDGAFAFAHEVITEFKKNEIDPTTGKRGVLIFTGATSSIRGNVTTSAFSAGKFALRALSQSLAKEFGKQNIHVAHVGIDPCNAFLLLILNLLQAIIDGGLIHPTFERCSFFLILCFLDRYIDSTLERASQGPGMGTERRH